MKIIGVFATLAIAAAESATAQDFLTPEEFEHYTNGNTLRFERHGSEYHGLEEYLPDRRVRMQAPDGTCHDGHWYVQGPSICFSYDGWPEPECWMIARGETGLLGRPTDSLSLFGYWDIRITDETLSCGSDTSV